MTKRPILVSIFMIAFAALAGAQQSGGVIRGIVDEDDGKPVSGATVTATQVANSQGVEKSVRSDENGGFVLTDLGWGKYTVSAEKPDAGYPLTPSTFYGSAGTPPVLEISAKITSANTKITFGSKMPAIVGTVIDDDTSIPIPATFLIRHVQEPGNALSVEQGPNYRILLPSGVPLTMEVSAQGHKTWYYPGTNDYTKKTSFVLSPSQSLHLNIRLDGDSPDCACLDRPQRWGLGPDSPAFQWRDLQDESSQRACNRHPDPNMLSDLISLVR